MALSRFCIVVGLSAAVSTTSMVANAAEPSTETTDTRRRPRYQAVEVQGLVIGELVPKPFFGIDAAYALGTENFQLRVGAKVAGSPPFRLGHGEVANIMELGQADVCAGKVSYNHRVRMCVGGEAGAWQHIWRGFEIPGRGWSPWVAGTLKADYRLGLTESVGVMFGVGVTVPVVGPSFRGQDQMGRPTPLIIPGPVGGFITLGTSFRIL